MSDNYLGRWATSSNKSFKDIIRNAASEIDQANSTIEALSIRWGIPTLILESILHLDNLSDELLTQLNKNTPPASVWFSLSEREESEIAQIINNADLDWHKFLINDGSNKISAVTSEDIKPETILYFSTKAKKYDVLRPKDRSALHSMGTYLKKNGALSIKQTSYLASLLKKIQDHGLMKIESPENDSEKCLEAQQLIEKTL